MNPLVRKPSFTASHPGTGTHHTHETVTEAPSPVAKVVPSRPTLHLPAAKQGLVRRTWPFQNALDSLDSLTYLNR